MQTDSAFRRRAARAWLTAVIALLVPSGGLRAQVDYFNLDAERPVAVEDALPIERHAFELQLAPLRVEGEPDGTKTWSVAPELAYGILPRTDVSLHVPLILSRDGALGGDVSGLSGLELEVFHNLNLETRTIPALALRGGVALPVGGLGPESARSTLGAVATRSFTGPRRALRLHANAEITAGEAAAEEDAGADGTRWRAGLALDRTFVFQSFLIVGNVYADRPLVEGADTRWIAGAGIRYQVTPRLAVDAGVERRLGDEGPDWAFTLGTANAFALRSLIPIGR
jgi:hypothetical protein